MSPYSKEYYEKNKESLKESTDKWLARNPGYWKKQYDLHAEDRKKYARDRNAKRQEYIAAIKLESGCSVCGYDKCATALEFHHADGSKEDSVSQMKRSTMERLNAEIGKCVILCANCHREAHS